MGTDPVTRNLYATALRWSFGRADAFISLFTEVQLDVFRAGSSIPYKHVCTNVSAMRLE